MTDNNFDDKNEKEVYDEFKRRDPYAGFVFEEVNDKLAIIIEGQDVIEHKIDRHYAEFCDFRNEVNEKFEAHQAELKDLHVTKADKRDLAVVEHRVAQLEKRN